VLWETGQLEQSQQARFQTRSGLLTADRKGDSIEMDFSIKKEEAAEPAAHLAEALGVMPKYVGKNSFDYLVEVESEAVLRGMSPNHLLLKTIPVRGVIVTNRSREYDFVSRFFAPGSGIDEDPVTGSAHCALGPYWAARMAKSEFTAYQASPRRRRQGARGGRSRQARQPGRHCFARRTHRLK
jgi:predicted PhzF superfamily epimerase YddE/YHI9